MVFQYSTKLNTWHWGHWLISAYLDHIYNTWSKIGGVYGFLDEFWPPIKVTALEVLVPCSLLTSVGGWALSLSLSLEASSMIGFGSRDVSTALVLPIICRPLFEGQLSCISSVVVSLTAESKLAAWQSSLELLVVAHQWIWLLLVFQSPPSRYEKINDRTPLHSP